MKVTRIDIWYSQPRIEGVDDQGVKVSEADREKPAEGVTVLEAADKQQPAEPTKVLADCTTHQVSILF